jgi:hypothetical protein
MEGTSPVNSNRARRRPGQRPRPLPPGDTLFTPGASPVRQAIERRSATWLLWLHQLPRWPVPVLVGALIFAGLVIKGLVGALLLVGFAGILGWLAAISWPRLPVQSRLTRVLVIAAVLAYAVAHAVHH